MTVHQIATTVAWNDKRSLRKQQRRERRITRALGVAIVAFGLVYLAVIWVTRFF